MSLPVLHRDTERQTEERNTPRQAKLGIVRGRVSGGEGGGHTLQDSSQYHLLPWVPADQFRGVRDGGGEDETGLVAEEEGVAHDALVQLHTHHLVTWGRVFTLGGGGEGSVHVQ